VSEFKCPQCHDYHDPAFCPLGNKTPPKVVTLGGDEFVPEVEGSEVQLVLDQIQEIVNGNGARSIAVCLVLNDGAAVYAQHTSSDRLLELLGAVTQLKHKVHAKYASGDLTLNSGEL